MIMFAQLFKQSHQASVIIAPNNRLAAFIKESYWEYLKTEHSVRPPHFLPIFSISAWLESLWQQTYAEKLLLSETHELFTWEKIISAQTEKELLHVKAILQDVRSAWNLLHQWQIPLETLESFPQQDVQMFYRWAQAMNLYLQTNAYLSRAQLPATLLQQTLPLLEKKEFIFVNVDELPPVQQALIRCLVEQGHKVSKFETQVTKKSSHCISFTTQDQELSTMAYWAKLEHQKAPDARIGCIVAGLDSIRGKVETLFTQYCQSDAKEMLFNLSGGKPLATFPIIRIALLLLDAHKNTWTHLEVGTLLRTPFIASGESEQVARQYLNKALHEKGHASYSLTELLYLANQRGLCPDFMAICKKLQQLKSPKCQRAHKWVQFIQHYLKEAGWPGERTLNSAEYQQVKRWHHFLDTLVDLDLCAKSFTWREFKAALYFYCQRHLFQIDTSAAPIQVLGTLEAAGLPFDKVWFAGMQDKNWPPTAQPNPFLPISLQQKHQMPHADAERELNYSQQLLNRVGKNTPILFCSYAANDEGQLSNPSPLLKDMPQQTAACLALPSPPNHWELLYQTRMLEPYSETSTVPMLANETRCADSSLLSMQAQCPFKAFAHHRLHAIEPPPFSPGLNPQQRGKLVHRALELFFGNIKSQRSLIDKKDDELQLIIEESSSEALNIVPQQPPVFLELEQRRLAALLQQWVLFERQRSPFKISALEKKQTCEFAGLNFTLRLDRVDEELDGSYTIIDYKTGEVNIRAWFGERPEDTQLPLYALTTQLDVTGLVLAKLKSGKLDFSGISLEANIPGCYPLEKIEKGYFANWADMQNFWRIALNKLATEFLSGEASVSPKNKQVCQYCKFPSLCRIYERSLP